MDLDALAQRVGAALLQRKLTLATAESCTGGWVAQVVTSVSGSSAWFDRGFITYTNSSKAELLGVDAEVLSRYGAVSEQTVRAMVEGALARSRTHAALAVTGIAGPTGGTPEKPVGTVWFAWAGNHRETVSRQQRLTGDRETVRRQSVVIALKGLLAFIER